MSLTLQSIGITSKMLHRPGETCRNGSPRCPLARKRTKYFNQPGVVVQTHWGGKGREDCELEADMGYISKKKSHLL
jgi:hypothetical protein